MEDNGDDNGDEVLISLQSGSNHFRPIIHYVSLVCQFNLYVAQKQRQKPAQSVSFLSALQLLIQTHTNSRDWNFVFYPELHKYSFTQLCIQITQLRPKKQFQNWCFVEPFSIFSRRIENKAATEMVIRSWPRMLSQAWEIPFNSHCDVT